MFTDIYGKVIELGIEHYHHESDLYIPVNDQTKKLIGDYEYTMLITTFKDRVSGKLCYDIPCAYTPWWEERVGKNQ
jgi:hypothetical protein